MIYCLLLLISHLPLLVRVLSSLLPCRSNQLTSNVLSLLVMTLLWLLALFLGTPLLQQHTPSPFRRAQSHFRTQDGMAAWAVAEGMRPIGEDFRAPGFVPAPLVGGVTYTVRSPQGRSPTLPQRSYSGRRLFPDHGDWQPQLSSRPFQPAAALPLPLQSVEQPLRGLHPAAAGDFPSLHPAAAGRSSVMHPAAAGRFPVLHPAAAGSSLPVHPAAAGTFPQPLPLQLDDLAAAGRDTHVRLYDIYFIAYMLTLL